MTPNPSETALAYHSITKHHVFRQARSLGFMDWENQPNPFRRYQDAAEVHLPLGGPTTDTTWQQGRQGPDLRGNAPMELSGLGRLLELGLGLTAWKEFEGNRWSLRANPSSGNLHPTEAYVIAPNTCIGLPAGVLHYAPHDHLLELRCSLNLAGASRLTALLPKGGFLIALTSIYWREAWKYGERALRYCALDTGHAIGALDYAAACVGMSVLPVTGWTDGGLGELVGTSSSPEDLDPWDREHPDLLLAVLPLDSNEQRSHFPLQMERALEVLGGGTWHGTPNDLSQEYHDWDVIPATGAAVQRAAKQEPRPDAKTHPSSPLLRDKENAGQSLESILRRRRSAYSMRAGKAIALHVFAELLDATLARPESPPWRGWPESDSAHLVVFVHRVEGLTPGLYFLERNPKHAARLRTAITIDCQWTPVADLESIGFGHLRLSLLREGNCESIARQVSCQQDIAADGAFSLGMLCDFSEVVTKDASAYRRLFWECGLIGQALYIEAVAHGLSATGIGCYFDDSVHELLGLQGEAWQVMYHFTVGDSIEGKRLQTHPPYAHIQDRVASSRLQSGGSPQLAPPN